MAWNINGNETAVSKPEFTQTSEYPATGPNIQEVAADYNGFRVWFSIGATGIALYAQPVDGIEFRYNATYANDVQAVVGANSTIAAGTNLFLANMAKDDLTPVSCRMGKFFISKAGANPNLITVEYSMHNTALNRYAIKCKVR